MFHTLYTEGLFVIYWFVLWQALAFCYENFLKFLEKKSGKEHDEDI